MSTTDRTISPEMLVSEVVHGFPATLPVFREFGIDSCCGGGHSLHEAARRHVLRLDALLEALEDAITGG